MVFELNKWLENKREGDVIVEHIGDFTSAYIDSVLVGVEEKLVDRVDLESKDIKLIHETLKEKNNIIFLFSYYIDITL